MRKHVIDISHETPGINGSRKQYKTLSNLNKHPFLTLTRNCFLNVKIPDSEYRNSSNSANWCFYVGWYGPKQANKNNVTHLPKALSIQSIIKRINNGGLNESRFPFPIPNEHFWDFATLLTEALTAGNNTTAPGLLLPYKVIEIIMHRLCSLLPKTNVMMITDGIGGGLADVISRVPGLTVRPPSPLTISNFLMPTTTKKITFQNKQVFRSTPTPITHRFLGYIVRMREKTHLILAIHRNLL